MNVGLADTRGWTVAAATALMLLAGAALSAQPVRGLTGAPQLARVYDAIFDARFGDVPKLLDQACPPAPQEACQVVETVALWWRTQIDPNNTSRDAALSGR